MLRDSAAAGDEGGLPKAQAERNRRRTLGIYYTPPEAAKVLARWAIRRPNETVLEPSFGGCAMLAAAASVFKALGNSTPSKQLYGYDVDAAAFVHLAQLGIDNAEGHFKLEDFLRSNAGGLRVDAVLANPPFVSYHRLDRSQREFADQLRLRYLPTLPRLASLWVHFVLHSMSFLRTGGRMAFVLPNAVGTADYAKPLIRFLQSRFVEVELVHVSERLFIQAGADERISLLLLSGYTPTGDHAVAPVRSRDVVSVSEIAVDSSLHERPGQYKQHTDIRAEATAALNSLYGHILQQLDAVATVRIGEVVGDVKFFVRPLSEWRQPQAWRTALLLLKQS